MPYRRPLLALALLVLAAPRASAQITVPTLPLPTTTTTTSTTTTTTTTTTAPTTTTTAAPTTTTSSSTTSTTAAQAQSTGLSITVPSAADLGAGTGNLGSVTVVDSRTSLARTWTATAQATSFTTGAGGAGRTVPATNVSYWSGPATSVTGAVASPGQLTAGAAQPIDSAIPVFSALTALLAPSSVTWNPGIIITAPPNSEAGQYQGIITHSVL